MLKVTDVAKVLGGKRVLEGVSFEVGHGEIAIVRGENGSGKSTLLRVVTGLLGLDRGSVVVCGAELGRDEVAAKREMGYVPDATDALPDLLVREFIELVWALKRPPIGRDMRPTSEFIARLGLTKVWGQAIGALSFGQRKRMCLLAALCGDPWLLVLDEPSNGLDPEGVDLVVDLIDGRRAQRKGTLLATNDPAFVERLTGRRLWLEGGRIIPG